MRFEGEITSEGIIQDLRELGVIEFRMKLDGDTGEWIFDFDLKNDTQIKKEQFQREIHKLLLNLTLTIRVVLNT